MKTATQILSLSILGIIAALGFARPAVAQHNHLRHASQAAAEVASHARHVQYEISSAALTYSDRQALSMDAAQLEVSARRLQAFINLGDLTRTQLELGTTRELARHLSQHARHTTLGYEPGFRAELSEIFEAVNEVNEEVASELEHYRPIYTRPVMRPRISFSFAP
jgi:hypothetical protein